VCTSTAGGFEVESSRNEGTGRIDFKGCELEKTRCFSVGDSAGTVLVSGSWHLVLKTTSGVDKHLFLFVLPTTGLSVECPGTLFGELLLTGGILGSIVEKSGSVQDFTLNIDSSGAMQEYTEYENNSGTLVDISLKVSLEGRKPRPILLGSEETLEFSGATSIEN
jgi:hypothetical protein